MHARIDRQWRSEAGYADYSKDVRTESGIVDVMYLNLDPAVGTAASEIQLGPLICWLEH